MSSPRQGRIVLGGFEASVPAAYSATQPQDLAMPDRQCTAVGKELHPAVMVS